MKKPGSLNVQALRHQRITATLFIALVVLSIHGPVAGSPFPAISAFPDTTVVMDFENVADFSLSFGDWTVNDMDQHTTYGIQDHTFPHQMEPMAYICFNPAQVVPSMASDAAIQPHTGQRFGACFSSNPPSNNDWFISPRIQLDTNGVFSFWIKSYNDIYGLDKYQVLVSTTGNDPANFTPISGPDSLQTTIAWTRKSFSLAQFNGQLVYLAIRCVSNDNWLMMIDDLEVKTRTSTTLHADFSADITSPKVGEPVNFTDQSSGGPVTWLWNFNGGSPSTANIQNPSGIKYSQPGTYTVSLTVTNQTSSDTETKEGYITVSGYPASVSMDFESVENFSLDFNPWTVIDVGGGNTYGISQPGGGQVNFPHTGEPMAWICFNPSLTVPPLTNMQPHTGQRLGCSFSSMPPNNPNNKWLISPRLTLGAEGVISFWAMTYNSQYGYEKYNVAVSTTEPVPSQFVPLTGTPEEAPTVWTQKSYNLSAYVNQTVYIAIQCVTNDGFIFMVDDIIVTSTVGMDDEGKDEFGVFPNPCRNFLTVVVPERLSEPLKIEMVNAVGKTLRTWHPENQAGKVVLDTSGLPDGIYLMVVRHGSSVISRKISVIR